MKSQHKLNIEESLQTVAKLELLLKMVGDIDSRNLDEILGILLEKWKELSEE